MIPTQQTEANSPRFSEQTLAATPTGMMWTSGHRRYRYVSPVGSVGLDYRTSHLRERRNGHDPYSADANTAAGSNAEGAAHECPPLGWIFLARALRESRPQTKGVLYTSNTAPTRSDRRGTELQRHSRVAWRPSLRTAGLRGRVRSRSGLRKRRLQWRPGPAPWSSSCYGNPLGHEVRPPFRITFGSIIVWGASAPYFARRPAPQS